MIHLADDDPTGYLDTMSCLEAAEEGDRQRNQMWDNAKNCTIAHAKKFNWKQLEDCAVVS